MKGERWLRRGAINFAIQLAEMDLPVAAATTGYLPNVVRDFFRFGFLRPTHDLEADRLLLEALRAKPALLLPTIETVRKLLTAVADHGTFKWTFKPGTVFFFDGAANVANTPRRTMLHRKGASALEQAAVWRLHCALDNREGDTVRRCAWAECGRLFLPLRPGQIYCSRQCAATAVFERYKQRHGESYVRQHRKSARESARRMRAAKLRTSG